MQQPGNPQQPGVPGYPPLPGPTPSPDYPGYPPQPGYPPNWYPPQAGYSPQAYPPQYQSYPPSYYNAPYGYAQAPAGYAYSPSGWVPIVQAGPQPGLVWAGIGIRIGAMALDLLFLFAFLMAVSVVADLAGYHATGSRLPSSDASQWIWGLSDLFIFLLVPACWYVFQGTPGQRALGVRVVRASNGESLGLVRSALRYLVWVACLSSVVLAIVAAALAKQDPQKRAWTDLAGDSVVVRKG